MIMNALTKEVGEESPMVALFADDFYGEVWKTEEGFGKRDLKVLMGSKRICTECFC